MHVLQQYYQKIKGMSSWCNGKSDGQRNRSKRVRTPVALFRSLSGKIPLGKVLTPISKPLKWIDQFTYLASNISSTENDVCIRLAKACNASDKISILWKCVLPEPSQLMLQNTPTPSPMSILDMTQKTSDDEASVLELWGMYRTYSLPLRPVPLWLEMVEPKRVPCMGQFNCMQTNKWHNIELILLYRNTWNHLTVYKQMSNFESNY